MTVHAYLRASLDSQGLSCDAQRDRISGYATSKGLRVSAWWEDHGVTSRKPLASRPAGRALLQDLTRGDHLLVAKLDRVWRSVRECLETVEDLEERGVTLHLIDLGGASVDLSTPMGRLWLTMAAGFAEFERSLISERTKAALAQLKRDGKRLGRAPYGENQDGSPNPEELQNLTSLQKLVTEIGPWRAAQALNARLLHRDEHTPAGIRPRKAEFWSRQSLTGLLQRARNRGAI